MKNVKCARCVRCGKEYEAIPNLTNCSCGGILDIVYDYDYIKAHFTKETLKNRVNPTMWRYRELLPVEDTTPDTPLRVGWSPLYEEPKLAELLDIDLKNAGKPEMANLPDKLRAYGAEKAAAECGVGVPTLQDIVKELVKPGRDPRDELPAPILRTDVLELKDLKPGMVLSGTVRNVIDFGVFVDIGVHQDGLVHISQVSNKFIKHPSEVVSVGDVVKVAVLDVDQKRGRISLTMKGAK